MSLPFAPINGFADTQQRAPDAQLPVGGEFGGHAGAETVAPLLAGVGADNVVSIVVQAVLRHRRTKAQHQGNRNKEKTFFNHKMLIIRYNSHNAFFPELLPASHNKTKQDALEKKLNAMEDLVLSIPTQDHSFLEQLAARMGWTVRSRDELIDNFIASCSKDPMMTDEEIQAEVNAVRYGK